MSQNPTLTEGERAELERLRAENAALRAQVGHERTRDTKLVPGTVPVARQRWRTIVATLLIVVACMLGAVAGRRLGPCWSVCRGVGRCFQEAVSGSLEVRGGRGRSA